MLLTEYDYDTDIAVQRQEAYEDGMEQGISQGIQQGSQQKAIETAKNFILKNIDLDTIAECTELPLETIKKLATEQNTQK